MCATAEPRSVRLTFSFSGANKNKRRYGGEQGGGDARSARCLILRRAGAAVRRVRAGAVQGLCCCGTEAPKSADPDHRGYR